MSRHICFQCLCGEAGFEGMSRFTTVVWDDLYGWLGALGVENPYRSSSSAPVSVDGVDLLRWWEDVLGWMHAGRDRLPTLYEIWRERPLEGGTAMETDAGYFAWRGAVYMVDTSYDRLFALRLPPGEVETRAVPYALPVLERIAPELDGAFPEADEIALDAAAFERIFQGSPLILEHGNLLDVFADDLRDAVAVARHAANRREPVSLFEI
ncbi:MAG TPA: hypothetical protein VHG91_02325 [Longimicrobium sp.]|nr:hypothetical protein [Longimicrobium sp.]